MFEVRADDPGIGIQRKAPYAGDEREIEKLGDLRPDLPCVGVDGVTPDEDEVEVTARADGSREGTRSREGVRSRERVVADVYAGHVDITCAGPGNRLA